MPIWQLCANLLIPNCLRSNLSYSPLAALELYVKKTVSKSYLYKLTMRKQIPHYKPMGKMCYFNRAELEEWLQQNRCATDAELSQKAAVYCQRKGAAV